MNILDNLLGMDPSALIEEYIDSIDEIKKRNKTGWVKNEKELAELLLLGYTMFLERKLCEKTNKVVIKVDQL